MKLDTAFAGGRIDIEDVSKNHAELAIATDEASDFMQWFAFRTRAKHKEQQEFVITNASNATYPGAWDGFRVSASYDGKHWFTVPTRYEDGQLLFGHKPQERVTYYAYFALYPLARLEKLVQKIAEHCSHAQVLSLGTSAMGHPVYEVQVGNDQAERDIWLIARQHPGESPASWAMEGLLRRLTMDLDRTGRQLLATTKIHLVPMMNPDGVVLGNMRTTLDGIDLNRAWNNDDDNTPEEVRCVQNRMKTSSSVLCFVDIHADETYPYAFVAGSEGNPSYDGRIAETETMFEQLLGAQNQDLIVGGGYEKDAPGDGDLRTANNNVGEMFNCASLTLELPMKDCGVDGTMAPGWSLQRCKKLGADLVDVMFDTFSVVENNEDE